VRTVIIWLTALTAFVYLLSHPDAVLFLMGAYHDHDPCGNNYLSEDELAENERLADNGDISAFYSLKAHALWCDDNADIDKKLRYYKKYQFIERAAYQLAMRAGLPGWDKNIDAKSNVFNIERKAIYNQNERIALAHIYGSRNYNRAGMEILLNIPKSLYYSKLDGCDTNKEYSYASYLHALFHNYPDNKEYVKVAYAMILFTKFNAKNFYNYSNFETLERNMTSRLDSKEVSYVIRNYQDIINKECEGILADHSQVPTEAKLNRYAFPLKSDDRNVTKD
jgi:hypothetical protein